MTGLRRRTFLDCSGIGPGSHLGAQIALGTVSLAVADVDVAAKRAKVFAAFGAKDWSEIERISKRLSTAFKIEVNHEEF